MKTKKTLRAAIIGLGSAGTLHISSLKKIPEMAQISALCDTDEKTLKRIRRYNPQAETFVDYNDMLDRGEIDSVHICLPHCLHREAVVAAAKAKKHILCEKPIANTLQEADEMITKTKKAGVTLMIAENQLFLPAHHKIKEILKQKLIGEIKMIRTYEGGSEITSMSNPDSWKCKWDEGGGGAWMDSGVHRLAVLHYLVGDTLGEIAGICGKAERLVSKVEGKADDNCIFCLQFDNGALGEIAISFTEGADWNCAIELHGTNGLILENHNWQNPIRLYSNLPGPNQNRWVEPEVYHEPYPGYYRISFQEEIRHFYECLLQGKEPESTAEDARKALEVILMGYEASRKKQWVFRKDFL